MIELMVVIAIMGVMAAIVGFALVQPGAPPRANSLSAAVHDIADARRTAIRSGAPVTIAVSVDARPGVSGIGSSARTVLRATALPDGSVIADTALGIDRLTGKPQRSRSPGT